MIPDTMASTKAEQDLAALRATVTTITALLLQLKTTSTFTDSKYDSDEANPLDLAHDTASLIKAHSTKLSLLIINKPFTATAINKVLQELVSGALPSIASAVQICTVARYTKAMSDELQWRVKKVLVAFGTFLETIPLDGKILSDDAKNGTGKTVGKGSLASTGAIWEACEGVMALKTMGIAGLIIKKAQEYRDLLADALEELHEWGEEESEGGEEDGMSDDEQDDIFGSQRHITSDDPEKIRPRLESSQKRLRLIITM